MAQNSHLRKSANTSQGANESKVTISGFQGPLPPPVALAEYDKILPGSADRILTMAESEQKHRHEIDRKGLATAVRANLVGQCFGFVIGVIGVVGGIYLVSADRSLSGLTIFVGSIASLVGVYIFRQRRS